MIAGWLERQGVELHLDSAVRRIERTGDELEVIADGASARGRVVVMATGVAPRGELAAAAGIELDGGAVPVDASMRSADPGVLAAGDVVQGTERVRRAARCASSTGATRFARARSPARSLRGPLSRGTRSPGSGRRSATAR